jgi:hypothetical protein
VEFIHKTFPDHEVVRTDVSPGDPSFFVVVLTSRMRGGVKKIPLEVNLETLEVKEEEE